MKKIVFVLPHMLCGGVEKALLSLINEMPEDKYQISIILAEKEGDFLSQIPANISVDKTALNNILKETAKSGWTTDRY